MAIPVHREPEIDDPLFRNVIESCHFCQKPTRYWHENTNNPVCPKCAKLHKVAELPDYGQNIRRMKRNGTFKRD